MWAFLSSHSSYLCWPIQQPCAAAHCILNGQCKPIANWPMQRLVCNFLQADMGQLEPIANWPMQGLALNFLQAAVGQLKSIGKRQFITNMGQYKHLQGSHPSCPCRPTQQSHAAAHCVLNGPM